MEKRKNKSITLRFAKENKRTWQFIKSGKKTVETRAGSPKYISLAKGDILIFSCDSKKFSKKIKKVSCFKTISALIKKYDPNLINPGVTTLDGMEEMYYSYPGYREKIREFGLIAFELE